MKAFEKYLIFALVILGILTAFSWQFVAGTVEGDSDLLFFYHPDCPHCADEKPFLTSLEEKYDVTFSRYDVTLPENKELIREMQLKYNITRDVVPLTIIYNHSIIGFNTLETTGAEIEAALNGVVVEPSADANTSTGIELEEISWLGNLQDYSIPTLAIILGLLDGFNPCAMWVLVVLIGFVAQMKERRRIWLIVGSFVAASGILYFLFMTAWLNAFLFIGTSRYVMLIVGLLALYMGVKAIKEFITKEDTVCKVGDAEHKKKTIDRMKHITHAPLTWATVGAIIVLAFVVNSIEFACSSGIPAVFVQILTLANLNWITYYWWIFVYTFFFMLDDLIIFSIAAFAVSKATNTDKYLRWSNIIGGTILLALGAILVFFPDFLTMLA